MAQAPRLPKPRSRMNQLGGTGPDADKGKQRTEFEDTRRGGNQGGADRPPVYKPQDDGQRGGYVGRSSPVAKTYKGKSMALGGGGRFASFVDRLVAEGKSTSSAKAIAASAGRKAHPGMMGKYSAEGRARAK